MQQLVSKRDARPFQHLSLGIALERRLLAAAANRSGSVSYDTLHLGHGQASTFTGLDLKQGYPLSYRSSAAMRLAHSFNQTPRQLAQAIAAIASGIGSGLYGDGAAPHLFITPAGNWVEVQVAAAGVAQWLQYLLTAPIDSLSTDLENAPVLAPPRGEPPEPALWPAKLDFRALHAHARCCSILQLAQEMGTAPAPSAVPWLAGNLLRATGCPQQALLQRLIQTLDYAAQHTARTDGPSHIALQRIYVKGANLIGQAFEDFHRGCRPLSTHSVFGKAQSNSSVRQSEKSFLEPALNAQVDLGLIGVTQQILALFLKALGLTPPVGL